MKIGRGRVDAGPGWEGIREEGSMREGVGVGDLTAVDWGP